MAKSFDEIALEELFGEAQDIFFEILGDLKNSTPDMIHDIEQAVKNKNHKEIELTAHTLKGVLANFCALAAKNLAFELEVMGKDNSEGDFGEKLSLLRDLMDELIKELENFKFKS